MKGTAASILVLLMLFAIPAIHAEQTNCMGAIVSGDFAGASDCYSNLGDAKMRDATNALVVGNYTNAISLGKEALKYHSGYGLCFSFGSCGGAAHDAMIMAVATEKMSARTPARSIPRTRSGTHRIQVSAKDLFPTRKRTRCARICISSASTRS